MEKEGKQCLKNVDVEEVPPDSVKAFTLLVQNSGKKRKDLVLKNKIQQKECSSILLEYSFRYIMDEKPADKKIKRNLEHAAAMIMCWIPKDKRNQYLNYFYSLFTD